MHVIYAYMEKQHTHVLCTPAHMHSSNAHLWAHKQTSTSTSDLAKSAITMLIMIAAQS